MVFNYLITSGVAGVLTLVPLAMILSLILRNKSGAVLCMECQQCRATCPVLETNKGYIGPKDIMVSVKSGKYDDAIRGHVELCTGCAACVERCPRGLGVDELCIDIYNMKLKKALNDESISTIPDISNPKMKRVFEAVVRRIKGERFSLPWSWITKAQRIRKYFNPFEDELKRPSVNEQAADGAKELMELKDSLRFKND